MEKMKHILAVCCCCVLITLLWSGSCTAEAAGGKKLIRKELHDTEFMDAYGSHVITEYTYNEAGQKTRWTVSTSWDEDEEPEVETFYAEYNADGTLKREYVDEESYTAYEYYNNGQLRAESTPWSIKHYDPFGTRMDARPWELYVSERDEPIYCTLEERRYQYDDAGRIILFEVKSSLSEEPLTYEYSYDAQGRISNVMITNSDLNSIEFLYMSDGGYIIRWKQENYDHSYVWEEEYNERNQIVRYRNTASFFDQTGAAYPESDYGINYSYNTEGDLITETGWGQGPIFMPFITDYRYERSNGVETVTETRYDGGVRDGSGMVYKTEYQYDRDGDLVKKLKYNCDENGVLESAPYFTELYMYEGAAPTATPTPTPTPTPAPLSESTLRNTYMYYTWGATRNDGMRVWFFMNSDETKGGMYYSWTSSDSNGQDVKFGCVAGSMSINGSQVTISDDYTLFLSIEDSDRISANNTRGSHVLTLKKIGNNGIHISGILKEESFDMDLYAQGSDKRDAISKQIVSVFESWDRINKA